MDREVILNKYEDEEKIFAAQVLDKIRIAKTRNQIVETDFLDMYKQKIAKELLCANKEKNYTFYKVDENLDKALLFVYPEKYKILFDEEKIDYSKYINIIRIKLPNELKEKYSHKDYLSGIMKLGIKREKIGDIIVFNDSADIIVKSDICEYIFENLKALTRFSKATFSIENISNLRKPQINVETKRITVSSIRLDNVVSEIANCSRTEASNLIKEQRVYINYEKEDRNSRFLNENDIIVLRGKGKFKISKMLGETKKGKVALEIEHYV